MREAIGLAHGEDVRCHANNPFRVGCRADEQLLRFDWRAGSLHSDFKMRFWEQHTEQVSRKALVGDGRLPRRRSPCSDWGDQRSTGIGRLPDRVSIRRAGTVTASFWIRCFTALRSVRRHPRCQVVPFDRFVMRLDYPGREGEPPAALLRFRRRIPTSDAGKLTDRATQDVRLARRCHRDGPVALHLRQPLAPVEGTGVRHLSTHLTRQRTGKTSQGTTSTISPTAAKIATVDSVAIAGQPHGAGVPAGESERTGKPAGAPRAAEVEITCGNGKSVSILEAGHRLGDAVVRSTALKDRCSCRLHGILSTATTRHRWRSSRRPRSSSASGTPGDTAGEACIASCNSTDSGRGRGGTAPLRPGTTRRSTTPNWTCSRQRTR